MQARDIDVSGKCDMNGCIAIQGKSHTRGSKAVRVLKQAITGKVLTGSVRVGAIKKKSEQEEL